MNELSEYLGLMRYDVRYKLAKGITRKKRSCENEGPDQSAPIFFIRSLISKISQKLFKLLPEKNFLQ